MKKKNSRLQLILRFADGSKRFFAVAVVASLLTTILNSMTPQVFRFTVDEVIGGRGYPYLKEHIWIMAFAVIGIAVSSGLSTYVSRVYTAKAGEDFTKNIRDTLFAHVQRLPMEWHSKHQTGDIIQRCTSDVEVIRNFVLTQMLEVFRTSFLIMISFVIMFSMNVKLSLIVLAFIPVVVAYSGIFFHLIARNFTAADEAEGELSTVVQENVTGVRVVRAFGREQYEIARFNEKNNIFAKLWIKLGTLSGLYWGVGDLITGFQVIAVVVFGAIEAVHGSISVGEFIAFAAYNTILVWPIRGLGRILSDMSKAGVSFDRVNYILEAEAECGNVQTELCMPEEEHPALDVVFSHVTFGYDPRQTILQDLSFEIKAGETLGILGGTGSGKSTLVQLLSRLYELPEGCGEITIGGRDVRQISRDWLRRHIGMVLQEPFLFSRTIAENIRAAVPDATMEEVRSAAKIACVDDAIMSFADGYETLVGERGVTLSGGQRQRIAMARMLLQKTPIMVFDDSLSAVDAQTDAAIRKSLRANKTDAAVILISHRIQTLMGADKILVLNKGRTEAFGTHEELLQNCDTYRQIYEIQMNPGGEEDGSI